jgi:hypothetical protein
MENIGGSMKHLIILISLLTAPLIIQGQDHYEVVCKRVEGCPVVNGTCPTCILVGGSPKRITKAEFVEWGKQLKESLRYQWDHNYYKDDTPRKKTDGWEWDGPTWKGLRVLY